MYQQLRIAKHTNNLQAVQDFYTTYLDFEILGDFEGHDGYDGVFIGLKDQGWHLEFTHSNHAMIRENDPDDMLVLYYKTDQDYFNALKKVKELEKFVPRNPYWQINGVMIKDPDGNQVMLCGTPVDR